MNFSLAAAPDGTPPFYRVLPGSIPDARTLAATLRIARDYRLRTASDESVQGRFFLGFVSLVLRAELEKRMHAAGLHKSMTDAAVLDELGKAKALVTRQGSRILLEVSKRQRLLLEALNIPALA